MNDPEQAAEAIAGAPAAGAGKPAAAAAKDTGMGSLDDSLQPLGQALLTAAKAAGVQAAGDPHVTAAFGLGWLISDVVAGRSGKPLPVGLPDNDAVGYNAQANMLEAAVKSLGVSDVDPSTVVNQLRTPAAASAQATAWEPKLAAALLGADVRYAKAYGVGRKLNNLTQSAFPQPFTKDDVAGLISSLDSLSSAFAAHASRSVANSLDVWANLKTWPGNETLLSAQGELWRSLLSGEKKGTEMLEPKNYLDAAGQVAAQLRAVALATLKPFAGLVVLIVVLLALGAWLLVESSHGGNTVAGLLSVLSAVGLTWKGIGGAVGKLAGKLEAPIWGAELDMAIKDAITLVPASARGATTDPPPDQTPKGDYAGRAARTRRVQAARSQRAHQESAGSQVAP
jgi:hypothetical protein